MPKASLATVAVLLFAAVGYLAYDPSAAREAANWARRQLGGVQKPDFKGQGTPNYMPVVR